MNVASEPSEPPAFSLNAIHLVRTTQQIHVQLSSMADQKASILMGATFVIFTITIGQARNASAPAPLLILGASAFFSAVFAVLAILPATHFKKGGKINLLFFGSFTQIPEDDYLDEMIGRLRQDESVYRTMVRDIYQNGVVLERKKYRLLGYAYRIFLAGLTASFVAFIVEYLLWRT
jgi:hypothetical protein